MYDKYDEKEGYLMMLNRKGCLIAVVLFALLLSACQPALPPQEPRLPPGGDQSEPSSGQDEEFVYGQDAVVETLEVLLLESFPVSAKVKISGYLLDGCTELDKISVEQLEMDFILMLKTRRPGGDILCTEALVPFEEMVDLDIIGLEAGTYKVIAQDQEATFTLDVDNVLQNEVKNDKVEYGTDAVLEKLDVNVMESFPIQVSVILQGYLRDGCTKIHEVISERDEQTFEIKIVTKRPGGDMMCTMAIVPFEETISLDVKGLPTGEYLVRCADLSENFTLAQDNEL